jgi:hypothetical protein
MSIDIEKLVEWLGPEGALAGLERGKLTQADLMLLAREQKLRVDKKAGRKQLAIELVMSRFDRVDRPAEQLLGMNADELRKFFAERMASSLEINRILEELGIAPSGGLRGKLSDFAAREISDLGMFQRVAKGQADRKVTQPEPRPSAKPAVTPSEPENRSGSAEAAGEPPRPTFRNDPPKGPRTRERRST